MNNRGSALIVVLVSGVAMAVALGVAYDMSVTSQKLSRTTRIKMTMAGVETRVRLLAASTDGYINCDTEFGPATTCDADEAQFQTYAKNIPGTKCEMPLPAPPNDKCGVIITGISYDGATNTLNATITYNGTEMSIRPIVLSLKVPPEILQTEDWYDCPAATPIFNGYRPDNSIICSPILSTCGANQYVQSVDLATLTVNCMPVTPAADCGGGILTGFSFAAGNFVASCSPQVNAFSFWGFAPSVTVVPQ